MPKTGKLDATSGGECDAPAQVSKQYPPIPENPLQSLHALSAWQDRKLWTRINYHQLLAQAVDEHYDYKLFVGEPGVAFKRAHEYMRAQQELFNHVAEDYGELMRRARQRQEISLLVRVLTAEPETRILANVAKREPAKASAEQDRSEFNRQLRTVMSTFLKLAEENKVSFRGGAQDDASNKKPK